MSCFVVNLALNSDWQIGDPERLNGYFTLSKTTTPTTNATPHWDLCCHESARLVFAGRGTIWNWFNTFSQDSVAFFAQFEADYLAQGVDFLTSLTGQFGFVVYDKQRQQLFAFRDQLGFYPLYWMVDAGKLWVATHLSELTAVKAQKQLSPLALASFFKFGYVVAPTTPIAGIAKLLPAEYLHCDRNGRVAQQRYWRSSPVVPKEQSIADYIEETREVLKASVIRHLNGSDNAALFLSGGLDSAILAALLAQLKDVGILHRVAAYTMGLDIQRDRVQYDADLPYAQQVATVLKLPHYERIIGADFPMASTLARAIPFYDGLQISPNFVTKGKLFERANRHGFTTLITGSIASFPFHAYRQSMIPRHVAHLTDASTIAFHMRARVLRDDETLHRLFPATCEITSDDLVDIMNPYVKGRIVGANMDDFQVGVTPVMAAEKMVAGHLPIGDRYAATLRMPFYDIEMWNYRQRVPNHLRGGDGRFPPKYLLIEAFRDVLPPAVISRSRIGYPSYYWYRGELASLQTKLFSDGVRQQFPFLDIAFAKQVIRDELSSRRKSAGRVTWGLIVLLLWHLHFIDGWNLAQLEIDD